MTNPIVPITNFSITNVEGGCSYDATNNIIRTAHIYSPVFAFYFKATAKVGNINASFSGYFKNTSC